MDCSTCEAFHPEEVYISISALLIIPDYPTDKRINIICHHLQSVIGSALIA
jgi:hypothetical protein